MKRKVTLRDDSYLEPYLNIIGERRKKIEQTEQRLTQGAQSISDFASAHEYYGLHAGSEGWVFREWAPNAQKIYLIGDFSGWQCLDKFRLKRLNDHGDWELKIPRGILQDKDLYRLHVYWDGGQIGRAHV